MASILFLLKNIPGLWNFHAYKLFALQSKCKVHFPHILSKSSLFYFLFLSKQNIEYWQCRLCPSNFYCDRVPGNQCCRGRIWHVFEVRQQDKRVLNVSKQFQPIVMVSSHDSWGHSVWYSHTYVRHRLDLLKARKSQGLWAELSFGLVSIEMILITIIRQTVVFQTSFFICANIKSQLFPFSVFPPPLYPFKPRDKHLVVINFSHKSWQWINWIWDLIASH